MILSRVMRACDVGNGAEAIDGWQEGVKHRVGDRIIRRPILLYANLLCKCRIGVNAGSVARDADRRIV